MCCQTTRRHRIICCVDDSCWPTPEIAASRRHSSYRVQSGQQLLDASISCVHEKVIDFGFPAPSVRYRMTTCRAEGVVLTHAHDPKPPAAKAGEPDDFASAPQYFSGHASEPRLQLQPGIIRRSSRKVRRTSVSSTRPIPPAPLDYRVNEQQSTRDQSARR